MSYCTSWNENIGDIEIKYDTVPLVNIEDDASTNPRTYTINSLYTINPNDRIEFQNSKLKVFYFDSTETDALITCFQEEIEKNKSEFRQMPEDNAVFQNDDYSEIFSITNTESVNKFRAVEGVILNKYKLSKFIGKYLRIGNLVNDKSESQFEKDILKIFDNSTIIENYNMWEKILTILIINQRYKGLYDFLSKVISAIEKLTITDNNKTADISMIRDTLFFTLRSALLRASSIVYNKKFDKIMKLLLLKHYNFAKILYNDNFIMLISSNDAEGRFIQKLLNNRLNYLTTRMVDKTLIPVLIDVVDIDNIRKTQSINLSNFLDVLNILKEDRVKRFIIYNVDNTPAVYYKYYPYMVNMHDISIMQCILEMYKDNPYKELDEICNKSKKIYKIYNYLLLKDSEEPYAKINIKCENTPEIHKDSFFIDIGNMKKSRFKIAIANVKIDYNNFEHVLVGKPNRHYNRYKDISVVVNEAIKQAADFLIMPESFVPFEWLPILA